MPRRKSGAWRLPACEIECVVADAANNLLADRVPLSDAARAAGMPVEKIPAMIDAVARWKGDILNLVKRVDLTSKGIAIEVDLAGLMGDSGPAIKRQFPAQIKRRGVEMRLVIEGADRSAIATVDAALVKAIVRAHGWIDDLVTGRAESLKAIAKSENVSDRYVSRLAPLGFLAPDIVEAILDGTQPVDLTA